MAVRTWRSMLTHSLETRNDVGAAAASALTCVFRPFAVHSQTLSLTGGGRSSTGVDCRVACQSCSGHGPTTRMALRPGNIAHEQLRGVNVGLQVPALVLCSSPRVWMESR